MTIKFQVMGPDGKAIESWLREHKPKQVCVSSLEDALVLENISCVDADGKEFEKYDRLEVANDIFRNSDRSQINFTPYEAIAHCEEQGSFLPSFALTCNILAALYTKSNDAEARRILMQYRDKGNGNGWHAQDTVIDWNRRMIVHHPYDKDFPSYGGNKNVNSERPQKTFSFVPEQFGDITLEDALKREHFAKYICNLTGLRDPAVLVEIGKLFGKPARVWVPNNPEQAMYTAAAWLGCNSDNFFLGGDFILYSLGAARRVRER